MNRRGKRLTVGVMVVGLAVVLVLAIAHWGTVRDHVEAWHFQLTRETRTIEPDPLEPTLVFKSNVDLTYPIELHLFRHVATFSQRPVIWAPEQNVNLVSGGLSYTGDITKLLEAHGWRVLEQRFPRKAYVVIRDVEPAARQEPDRLRGGGR
jgi:hypothetical protein